MSATPVFDYNKFVTLDGPNLVEYMEPLVNAQATTIPRDVLEHILSDLPSYDEYHLVYALELGMGQSPDLFTLHVPQYLAHENASVCCAAFRVLSKLPDEYVTHLLLDSVRRVPVGRTLFTEPINGAKVNVGINSNLVAELLSVLTKRLRASVP
jgi:hypothetical protein